LDHLGNGASPPYPLAKMACGPVVCWTFLGRYSPLCQLSNSIISVRQTTAARPKWSRELQQLLVELNVRQPIRLTATSRSWPFLMLDTAQVIRS
jgi:hypothetical protein